MRSIPESQSVPPALLAEAVARLRAGALVAFPTETVYGLGADASNPAALRRLYELKGRPSTHPVIVHLPDASHLLHWAAEIPPAAALLAQKCWPGPLTLILPKAQQVSAAVTGGQDSIGLRVPAHPIALALLRAFGGGVAAPSANRFGRVSPTTAAHVLSEFGAEAPLILDGGPCEVGIESTIVDARTNDIRILRPGMLGIEAIAATLSELHDVHLHADSGDEPPRVPGSTAAHYAPSVPMKLLGMEALLVALTQLLRSAGVAAVIARQDPPHAVRPQIAAGKLRWLSLGSEPASYAQGLYAAFRELESGGTSQILVEDPPAEPAWQAVRDRLARAAHD